MRYKLIEPGSRKGYKRWYVRFWGADGRGHEKPLKANVRSKAEKEAEQYITKFNGRPAGAPVTFAYAAHAYMAWKKPRKDDVKWIERLIDWMGKRDVREIKADDINRAADVLCKRKKGKEPLSNETRIRYVYTPASAILHYAAEQDWCSYRRIRRPSFSRRSNRRPASDSTMRLLLDSTAGEQRLLLAWLYETGQRLGDSLLLMWSDVDLERGLVRVGSSKTDDRGEIGLSPELTAMLRVAPKLPAGRVFPWKDRWAVYRWLKPLRENLGIQYTPHQSRHAMATDLRALGYDMRAIAERGLWRDERSAGRYVHHRSTAVKERGVVVLLRQGEDQGKKQVKG